MSDRDYYDVLGINRSASQAEIKRAYRSLVKQFHPDSQHDLADHERVVSINAAYEVLGDTERRHHYDQRRTGIRGGSVTDAVRERQARTVDAQTHYQNQKYSNQANDELQALWRKQVYTPVNRALAQVLNPFKSELNQLAADPFDDVLMEGFQLYLEQARTQQEKALGLFQSMPAPASVAGIAATLYYCINHVSDGLDELERFTMCYDDSYLNIGRELFRRAVRLRKEVQSTYAKLT